MQIVLVGGESLLVQCGEMVLNAGHEVLCVVSDSPEICRWAETKNIKTTATGKGLAGRLQKKVGLSSFDWLFSIANLTIISDDVLAMAKDGSVNFHDGPLPTYAGLNSPNWALLNGESQHGISWHLIEGGVDEGNILAQRMFDLPALPTALAINTKCYELAIESFPEVLDRIKNGDRGQTQDLARRTYFGKYDRPDAVALIDWTADASAIVRLVRALDFGPKYDNPMQLAKVYSGGETYLVREADVAAGEGEPGVVLSHDNGLLVAAGAGAVRITVLADAEGRPVELGDLSRFDSLTGERGRLTERNNSASRADGFWSKRLRRHEPLPLPSEREGSGQSTKLSLSGACKISCEAFGGWQTAAALFALRTSGKNEGDVGFVPTRQSIFVGSDAAFFSDVVPLRVLPKGTVKEAAERTSREIARILKRPTYTRDLIARLPGCSVPQFDVVIDGSATSLRPGSLFTITENAVFFDSSRLSQKQGQAFVDRFDTFVSGANPDLPLVHLPLLTATERTLLVGGWNDTHCDFEDVCVHTLFESQVDRTPVLPALTFDGVSLTYAELDERANRLAHTLRAKGVVADQPVGLYCHRSVDLVVAALAIMKAGGAYLPLDPDYPADRIDLMLEDSKAAIVVVHEQTRTDLKVGPNVTVIDVTELAASTTRPSPVATSQNLAYIIYTSGSTGRPKGVMIEHRNVSNFFTGMDERIPDWQGEQQKVFLALTSLSFDISVLELFWTLTRGLHVVVHRERERVGGAVSAEALDRSMDFGLFYWGNDDGQGPRKYRLLLEGAKLADGIGFTSIWTPERHFHAFGGPFPNPAVTGAAVAAVTKNLSVRSGSVVAPLHHPIRIAENWAVIDNLTNGKTGLGLAAGWHPDDFVLRPENTPPKNKPAMLNSIETLRSLWRGDPVEFPREDGTMHPVVTQPRPVSKELQLWLTTAGNPATYIAAAEHGVNVLTHLLGQSIEEVGEKIKIYHDALRKNGRDPADFTVTLMLHTYLDETRELAEEVSRDPMKAYLGAAAGLVKQYAWAFPTYAKPKGVESAADLDLSKMSDEENAAVLEYAFNRYFNESGLFGTINDAIKRVNQLKAIGIDEIGCLIDYGIDTDKVLRSLERVGEVLKATNTESTSIQVPAAAETVVDVSVPALIDRHEVTHMQSTPSMARLLSYDKRASSLSKLDTWLVGGEALPGALVADLRKLTNAHIENMYGPTETTIWSSTFTATSDNDITPIGTPFANTQLYVLDSHQQLVPPGAEGELFIGGDGVTRGYLFRDDLTAERFLPDPFRQAAQNGSRMYRTGDLVKWRDDGVMEFIGRVDHQVKLRGYRVELGEIEARLSECDGVREVVVIAREDSPGDKRLAAYIIGSFEEAALRSTLGKSLPEYMVPSHFVSMDSFPLTPNKKIDRKKLPAPSAAKKAKANFVAPEGDVATTIAKVWCRMLGVERVGSKDNFFDLGGHSLLVVLTHRELTEALRIKTLSITDLFRFPTLGGLAGYLADAGKPSAKLSKTAARAAARRDAMRRRRGS